MPNSNNRKIISEPKYCLGDSVSYHNANILGETIS